MNDDWKNDRAEAAMREGTDAIRKAAELKKEQEEALKWTALINDLSIGNEDCREEITRVIELIRKNYSLPEKIS